MQFFTEGKIASGKIKLSDKQKAKLKKFAFSKKIKQNVHLTESWIDYNDTPSDFEVIEKYLKSVGESIDDSEVWDVAREYEEMPNFTGIYIGLVYSTFANKIEFDYGFDWNDYDYDDNFRAGGFSVLGEYIEATSLSELEAFLERKQRERMVNMTMMNNHLTLKLNKKKSQFLRLLFTITSF